MPAPITLRKRGRDGSFPNDRHLPLPIGNLFQSACSSQLIFGGGFTFKIGGFFSRPACSIGFLASPLVPVAFLLVDLDGAVHAI
jgi:hypothetical protein